MGTSARGMPDYRGEARMVSWHLRPDWATCVYEGCYGHLLRSGVASQVLAGLRLIVCVRAGGCAVRWDGGLQPLQPLQVTRSEERPRRDSERARCARLIPLGLLRGRSRARSPRNRGAAVRRGRKTRQGLGKGDFPGLQTLQPRQVKDRSSSGQGCGRSEQGLLAAE